jgi:hypothetical protein
VTRQIEMSISGLVGLEIEAGVSVANNPGLWRMIAGCYI